MALTDKLTAIGDAIRGKTGKTAKLTLDQMVTEIEGISGSKIETITFDAVNPVITDYIADAKSKYTDANRSSLSVANSHYTGQWEFNDKPQGRTITAEKGRLIYVDESNGNVFAQTVDNSAVVRNLIPNRDYTVINQDNGGVKAVYKIKATGEKRALYVDANARNFRDIGGMACDGGTVKYGILYRGSQIDGDFATTEATCKMLHDQCRIRTEIDMRETPSQKHSLIGKDVNYFHLPLPDSFGNYHWIVTREGEMKQATAILKAVMESVVSYKPVYLHCTYGADRTGAMFGIIEGLLGCDLVSIDIDYELTNFAYGNKTRTYSLWVTLISRIKSDYSGDTFRDKLVEWIKANGEISADLLNAFRSACIDGVPDTITWNTEATEPEIAYPTNPTLTWTQGQNLSYSDGTSVTINANYAHCDYVSVDKAATYTSVFTMPSADTNYRVLAYDVNKTYLGVAFSGQVNGSSWSAGSKYSNCAYVRFRLYSSNATNVKTASDSFVLTKS